MSFLLIPYDFGISVLKKFVVKIGNPKLFENLKIILNDKKEQQERQKIFYKKEVKEKM
jgi:hypothetical protein